MIAKENSEFGKIMKFKGCGAEIPHRSLSSTIKGAYS